MNETKICKYCKSEIAKDAKICPNCRKKQKGRLRIIIGIIVVLLIISIVSKGGSNKTNNSNSKNSDDVVEVGGSFEDNGLKFTVNDAKINYPIKDEYGLYKLDDNYVYLMLDVTFENTGDGDKYVSIYDFDCYADNTSCEQKYVTETTGDFINTNLSSGRSVSFKTLYAVPTDASSIELEYESNIWTNNKVVIKIK